MMRGRLGLVGQAWIIGALVSGVLALPSSALALTSTTTEVASSQNPSVFGQVVTFTATVSSSSVGRGGTPTGSVTFLDGASALGTAVMLNASGEATFTTSTLAVASHTIGASYSGDATFSGSKGSLTGNPQVVDKSDTTTTVTSSANPSAIGQAVTLTATITAAGAGSGIATGSVTFLDGGSALGAPVALDPTGHASITTSSLMAGSHTITASYGGDANFSSASGSLTGNPQVVNAPSCSGLPNVPSPAFHPSATNPNQRFVQALYSDLLGRPPESGALGYFAGLLGSGVTRGTVALATESSVEYRDELVSSWYETYLQRPADSTALAVFAGALASEPDEPVLASLFGSNEYFARSGGSSLGFVESVYCDLLGRSPGQPEAQYWLGALGGSTTRTQMAQTILGSQEYRNAVAQQLYLRFLRRNPDNLERTHLVTVLGSATDEQAIASLVGSPEYFDMFNPAKFVGLTIHRGVVKLKLLESATVSLKVVKVLLRGGPLPPTVKHTTAQSAARAKLRLPKLRVLGTVHLGRHGKGTASIRWNSTVNGHKLTKGRYELIVQLRRRGKLIASSDAIAFVQR
jgi:hypothetical protein